MTPDDETRCYNGACPDLNWPSFRHLIQTVRQSFLNPELRTLTTDCVPRTLTTDLLNWGKTYLPDHFLKPPSAMHRWMAGHLDEMAIDRGTKVNVLGPRGGAKSTVATLAYPLREALLTREPYIWIISDTAHQACAHLENIKAELLDNERLARDYPGAVGRGPVWRAGRIVLRNGVTIEAFGTGQRIRGRRARANRPTLIICDDLQNDRHMESALQRAHTRTWFHGTLLKAGTPQTNVVNLATALHREALAMELTQTPGWSSQIFRSIDPWPFNTSLWEQWEQIYTGPVGWLSRADQSKDQGFSNTAKSGSADDDGEPSVSPGSTRESQPTDSRADQSTHQRASDATKPDSSSDVPGDNGKRSAVSGSTRESQPTDSPPSHAPTNQPTPNSQPLNPEPRQPTTDPAPNLLAPKQSQQEDTGCHGRPARAQTGDHSNPRIAARNFYKKHQQAMDSGAAVLWPQVEDLYTLMCLRAESGRSAFEREKQNSPLNPDLCEWPESYFTEEIWFDEWPAKPTVKTLALDPSKGTDSARGDYSAFISLAVDREGILYVQADMARRPTPQMVADGVEIYRRFQPHIFGVEANQFQELLAPEFQSAFRRQGLLGVHPWLIHNDANKRVRIRRLGPLLASRHLRLKADCPSTKMLFHQLQEFPIADHDDGPDALEMALRLASELLAGRRHNDGLGNRLPVGTY